MKKFVTIKLTYPQAMRLWNILHSISDASDDFGVIRWAKQLKKKLEKEWASHADDFGIKTCNAGQTAPRAKD